MKIEIQSGSSTSNSLTDRFGEQDSERSTLTRGTFGYQNKFAMKISASRRKELRRYWKEAKRCFSTTTTLQVCRISIL